MLLQLFSLWVKRRWLTDYFYKCANISASWKEKLTSQVRKQSFDCLRTSITFVPMAQLERLELSRKILHFKFPALATMQIMAAPLAFG